ncbi:MAG TPA: hypothetical protein VL463_30550, partial [Kofleriaceae bacterium]|nr:hypothetical protein [Kofleriaceae bacterium]
KLDHRAVDVPPATNGKPLDGDFGLSIDITKYDLVFDGVWTARATARVRWFDMRGREIADRVVHTDTLVGAKDEDQRALVRQASAQLVDILAPRVIAWSRSSP